MPRFGISLVFSDDLLANKKKNAAKSMYFLRKSRALAWLWRMDGVIGLLDSGVGGLSVLREIRAEMPEKSCLYVADSAWCPYGIRPTAEIQVRVFKLSDWLLARGAQVIVLACNSATIHAVEALRARCPVPVVGVEPAVKPAIAQSRSGIISVLATEASLAGEKFRRLVTKHASSAQVITTACPDFVSLVESGEISGPKAEETIKRYVFPAIEKGADVIVLGCTHYPFLRPVIEKIVGENVTVIDSGKAVARRIRRLFEEKSTDLSQPMPAQVPGIVCSGTTLFFTTGTSQLFETQLSILYQNFSATVEKLSL